MIDWGLVGYNTLVVILLVFVGTGVVPILSTLYQFIAIPFHAFKNHEGRAAPYLPRVVVVVPAWNEGNVVGASIDRLMSLEYPRHLLRIYVVDDASTDETPDIVKAKEREYPGSVFHLRREKGGEGKAHTLNFGIARALSDDWMQALLIMDADVIYLPDSLRRMTRHLADPKVGAVTAYIREGSADRTYLTRFIGMEYILAQTAARRAQNVLGALACLAGGAQLHSRENLEAIGGRIDTTSLAEDTITTFSTQLQGRKVVFEPYAIVLAEEPRRIADLWKQRLRWARGNVQVTRRYKNVWFRPSRKHRLGSFSFGIFWFSILLLPVVMILSSIGLIGLHLLHSDLASTAFRATWIGAALTYVYTITLAVQLDGRTGLRSWREAILFPGIISIAIMATAVFPIFPDRPEWLTLAIYAWISLSMIFAWFAKKVEQTWAGRVISPLLLYVIGYGPLLCAITFDSYIKEYRRADTTWDKTEKIGRVLQ